jgi:hypothetical protein
MLELDVPVGRKLDFLIQEFNRRPTPSAQNAMILRPPKRCIDIQSGD